MPTDKLAIHAVILAGGRGTRFWPRSRMRTPKQLLNIVGKETMLVQTVARAFERWYRRRTSGDHERGASSGGSKAVASAGKAESID